MSTSVHQLQNEYQSLVDSLSLMMKQYKDGGGAISPLFGAKLNSHLAAVAARINEMGGDAIMTAHTSTSIAEAKALIAEFKLLTVTAPAAPSLLDFSTGSLFKWGLLIVGGYLVYKYVIKAPQTSGDADPERTVLTNADEIPYEDLPAYAGGPKRKRHR